MTLKVVLFVLTLSTLSMAQAKPLEAFIECSCASWTRAQDGEMKLGKAHAGGATSAEFSDAFAGELLQTPWYQAENTKKGFASVTPGFLQSRHDYKTIFKNGLKSLDYVVEMCQVLSKDPGKVACGVSVTFPINENAKSESNK